jgi:hypothetical protein
LSKWAARDFTSEAKIQRMNTKMKTKHLTAAVVLGALGFTSSLVHAAE